MNFTIFFILHVQICNLKFNPYSLLLSKLIEYLIFYMFNSDIILSDLLLI
jgi:hypothetical protein